MEIRCELVGFGAESGADERLGGLIEQQVLDRRVKRKVMGGRPILLGGVASSPVLHEHRASVMRGLTTVLVGHARTVHDVELQKDPLAQVAPAFIVGGTADAILAYLDGRAEISVENLVTALTALWRITGNGAAEVARLRKR